MLTKVTINTSKLNTVARVEKALRIQSDIELIVNHDLFWEVLEEKLLSRDYADGELSEFRNKRPIEIYNHILSGREVLDGEVDYELDIDIDDYYTIKGVIGMTYPSKPTIYVNTKFFDGPSDMSSGSNVFHEEGHKLGFKHDFRRTARRSNSLCYLLNEAYNECWKRLIGKSKTVKYSRRKWYGRRYTVTKTIWVRK